MVTGAVPVELKVRGAVPVFPTVTLPKLILVALTLSVAIPATPDPLRLTTAVGLVDELLAMVSIPVKELA